MRILDLRELLKKLDVLKTVMEYNQKACLNNGPDLPPLLPWPCVQALGYSCIHTPSFLHGYNLYVTSQNVTASVKFLSFCV